MNFGNAFSAALAESKIRRREWRTGTWVVAMPSLELAAAGDTEEPVRVNERTAKFVGKGVPLYSQPYLAMYDGGTLWQPGWLPGQEDLFALDWEIMP